MNQLAINYHIKGKNYSISSRIFVLKSGGGVEKYTYIEAFSFKFVLRKKLSLKILNYLLQYIKYSGVDAYAFYFSDLNKVRAKLGVYMPDDTLNCVCNWIKEEID